MCSNLSVFLLISFILIESFLAATNSLDHFGQFESCESQWRPSRVSGAVITFVIPSKARTTILRTLKSLMAQTEEQWLGIVVFDGLVSNDLYMNKSNNLPVFVSTIPQDIQSDGRFCFQNLPTSWRRSNCAGGVRNHGMHLSITEWVGFVDDDDTLTPEYVERLKRHAIDYPSAAAVVFRMCQKSANSIHLIPRPTTTSLIKNDVGISFAVKRSIYHDLNYSFVPSTVEDFSFLDRLYNDHIPILMSQYFSYKVKNYDHEFCYQLSQEKLLQRVSTEKSEYTQTFPCANPRTVVPQLIFSEKENPTFHSNIKGLQSSLDLALRNKCFSDSTPIPEPIHIIFNPDETPKSPYFIQVQLEQRNNAYFTQRYRQKLSNALQIWEFNLGNNGIERFPGIQTNVYFIPTMLTLPKKPVYNCPSQSAELSVQFYAKHSQHEDDVNKNSGTRRFSVYRFGMYYNCLQIGNSFKLTSTYQSSCHKKKHTYDYCYGYNSFGVNENASVNAFDSDSICTDVMRRNSSLDVLVFGMIRGSYGNKREMLCDQLSSNGINVLCLQTTLGTYLNYFVCISKMIVVSHFSKDSALETHRIDPLLQINKLVIAESSHSSALDSLYSHSIPFVEFDKIIPLVKTILNDYDSWMNNWNYTHKVNSLVQSMTTTIDPLCYALSNLAQPLRMKYDIWLQSQPRPTSLRKQIHESVQSNYFGSTVCILLAVAVVGLACYKRMFSSHLR